MSISFKEVACGYGNKVVMDNVNFAVDSGEAVCVLGPNGIGKTTLFNTLFGFIRPLSGCITIDGEDVSKMSDRDKARLLSYVPQAYKYSYQFSVLDTVLMGRVSHIGRFSRPGEHDIRVAVDSLASLGVDHLKGIPFSELSGGQQQVVLIARALAQESKYVVMDEPASNLDFENKRKLIHAVRKLTAAGRGVLMTSHAPEQAFECCARTLLIKRGAPPVFGDTLEVLNNENLEETYGLPLYVGGLDVEGTGSLYACFADYS